MGTGTPSPALGEQYLTRISERVSYGLYFAGQNIFYILLLTFLVTYFTDIGIPAAAVGTLTLAVKIWDAVNDPVFGGIVDRVRFASGVFVPWLRISLVAIPVATVALFAIPSELSTPAKVTWAVLAYVLWDTAYTICDVPIFGLVTTLTNVVPERTTLMTIGRVAALVAAVIVSVVVPQARSAIGGWAPTAIVLSVIGLATMIPICFTATERIRPPTSQGIGVKALFSYIGGNKYLLIYFAALLAYGGANIQTNYALYLARHLFADESMATLLMIAFVLPGILIGFVIPALTRRIDKAHLFMWSLGALGLLSALAYFVGFENRIAFFAMLLVRAIPMGVITMLMFMFTPDCAEYGQFTTGLAAPGITFSIQTFSAKLTAAIASSLGAFALAFIGFRSGEGATQPDGFADRLWLVSVLIPAVGAVLAMLIFSRYKLRDADIQVMARANSGELSHEAAVSLLAER